MILILLFSFATFGQSKNNLPSRDIYTTLVGPTLLTTISYENLSDIFYKSNGFTGYRFRYDSNYSFKMISFGCTGSFICDSGQWSIKNGLLTLKSSKQKTSFDILKFDNYYILVKSDQRATFIKDFISLQNQFKNFKPVKFEGEDVWQRDRVIGYNLKNKYFIKEISE